MGGRMGHSMLCPNIAGQSMPSLCEILLADLLQTPIRKKQRIDYISLLKASSTPLTNRPESAEP
jgi:hypothetical protein